MGLPLVTLEDYKTYKKITKTDADQELGLIVDSVNTLVKTFVGHSIIDYYNDNTPAVEIFNVKPGQSSLQLNEWPIKNVIKVESRLDYQNPYIEVDSTLYFVDPTVDSIYIHNNYWQEGFGSTKVTYTAGWPETPKDLRVACLDLIHAYFKEEYKERRSIGDASINNSTSRASALASEWPIHIIRVLDMYRNV